MASENFDQSALTDAERAVLDAASGTGLRYAVVGADGRLAALLADDDFNVEAGELGLRAEALPGENGAASIWRRVVFPSGPASKAA